MNTPFHANGVNHAFKVQTAKQVLQMENLFKAVLHLVSTYGSMLQYEKLVWLLENCGADVGTQLHSRKTASAMIECIAHVWRTNLRDLMTSKCPITDIKRFLGWAGDKVTDKGTKQWLVSVVYTAYLGQRLCFFNDMAPVTGSAPSDDNNVEAHAAAGGWAVFQKAVVGSKMNESVTDDREARGLRDLGIEMEGVIVVDAEGIEHKKGTFFLLFFLLFLFCLSFFFFLFFSFLVPFFFLFSLSFSFYFLVFFQ